ncbi:MAG: mercuric reductase [Deinococcota bacterium]|nr:mercuric reductase [Deinococcota bacterium]
MNDSSYDFLIIGGGQAGIPLAQALAKAGRRVALAERKHLGGSCVNFGCTPTKAVLASARVAQLARRGAEFGLEIPEVRVNFGAVLKRAKDILMESRSGLEKSMAGDNPKLLRGHARFTGKAAGGFRLRVGEQEVSAQQVVVNTGTRDLVPRVEGLGDIEIIHAGNWLEQDRLPEHLVVMGGGYIGVEMSQFYRRMGSRVTVVEGNRQILGHEDEEVAEALRRLLEAEGVTFKLGAKVARVARDGEGIRVALEGDQAIDASHLFVATGRKPNTDDLGLGTVGVKITDKGILEADERLATNVPGIWAAGDVRGGPMFTHTAYHDYRVLESQLLEGGARTTNRVVPYAVFTDPELGRVGMTEGEAREAGKRVKVARYEMKKNGKAREIGESEGFIKVIAEEGGNNILGAAVLAAEGAELVHMYIDLMNAGAPYTVIQNALHIHPTLAEAVQSALGEFA